MKLLMKLTSTKIIQVSLKRPYSIIWVQTDGSKVNCNVLKNITTNLQPKVLKVRLIRSRPRDIIEKIAAVNFQSSCIRKYNHKIYLRSREKPKTRKNNAPRVRRQYEKMRQSQGQSQSKQSGQFGGDFKIRNRRRPSFPGGRSETI